MQHTGALLYELLSPVRGGGRAHNSPAFGRSHASPTFPSTTLQQSVPPLSFSGVPKRLWMFWDARSHPELVAACIAAMRRTNPGWNVTVMRLHDVHALGLSAPPESRTGAAMTRQRIADWYRLEVLAQHGGVYMDASNINLRSVENWVNTSSPAVQGFSYNSAAEAGRLVMENWAIASPSGANFTLTWRDHFADALRTGPAEWVTQQNVSLDEVGLNSYLAEHVAWFVTRRELSNVTYPTTVYSSIDDGRPFEYLMRSNWGSCFAAARAMRTVHPVPDTDFFKFRGGERDCTAPLWMYSLFWFWPFAPWGERNVASWLLEQLEAEPDLLAESYQPALFDTYYHWGAVGALFTHIWAPILLLIVFPICAGCYGFNSCCRKCTDRRASECSTRMQACATRAGWRRTGTGEVQKGA